MKKKSKIENKCYLEECNNGFIKKHHPFCCKEHHEEWAKKNYGKNSSGKRKLTVKEMREELEKWGKEKRPTKQLTF